VRDELSKILVSGRGGRGLGLLLDTGLLEAILPEVAALDGVPQPPRFHPEGDVLTHTRMLLDGVRGGGEEVALAALLHDVGKAPTLEMKEGRPTFPRHAQVGAAMAEGILRRLRYPNRVIEQVTDLVDRHMDWPQLQQMREAKRRRLLLREDLPLHMELHRLDCGACHGDLSVHAYALEERRKLEAEPPPVKPLLTGHDLIGMGFAPGPAFKAMLEAIVDAQLEGAVKDADGARAFVRARYGGGAP
jgi:poly(A) polymerase